MPKRSIALVGMRYHSTTFELLASLRDNPAVSLRREASNPHDSNAIAAFHRGQKIGHIDKDSASVLAPIMDRKIDMLCVADASRASDTGKTIPLTVEWENEVGTSVPKATPITLKIPSITGIYAIGFNGISDLYVGQSINIDSRIHAHLSDLRGGRHPNPALQRAFHQHGESQITINILETMPTTVSGELAIKHWLAKREEHWVSTRGTFNKIAGGFAATAETIAEFNKIVGVIRRDLQQKINALKSKLAQLERDRNSIINELTEIRQSAARSSVLGRMLFGKYDLEKLGKPKIAQMQALEKRSDALYTEIRNLGEQIRIFKAKKRWCVKYSGNQRNFQIPAALADEFRPFLSGI